MNTIGENIAEVVESLPENIRLVAVSKFHPVSAIEEAYQSGQRIFGESKVQELLQKQTVLPTDIEWHFIGHLQRNKVKMIVPFISLIHSVDSPQLLAEIDKCGKAADRIVNCLLEIHIASEESKYGFTYDRCISFLEEGSWKDFTHVRICGVMGMATFTDNFEQVAKEFAGLKQFYDKIKNRYFGDKDYFKEISMGMSQDYHVAVKEGSTLVRVGSRIFGERKY